MIEEIAKIHVAVLLTCFNRKQKTLDCLCTVFNQVLPESTIITVYLVDDGSTDETSETVRENYPQVNILQGTGNLYWTGGMQLAFSKAMEYGYDFYLWLNDDTLLYPDALEKLLETFQWLARRNDDCIVVGSTKDEETNALSYGGVNAGNWTHPCRFRWLNPTDLPQRCDTMNGNCVLIPHCVTKIIGGLDTKFRHYAADFDYGLRAKKKNISTWIAPNFVGTCEHNKTYKVSKTVKANLRDYSLLQKLNEPKGLSTQDVILHPIDEWKAFTRRHAGPLWFFYWLFPYRRIALLYLSYKLRLGVN
jgi:GT2 family glycosyltransferase